MLVMCYKHVYMSEVGTGLTCHWLWVWPSLWSLTLGTTESPLLLRFESTLQVCLRDCNPTKIQPTLPNGAHSQPNFFSPTHCVYKCFFTPFRKHFELQLHRVIDALPWHGGWRPLWCGQDMIHWGWSRTARVEHRRHKPFYALVDVSLIKHEHQSQTQSGDIVLTWGKSISWFRQQLDKNNGVNTTYESDLSMNTSPEVGLIKAFLIEKERKKELHLWIRSNTTATEKQT